jgi:quinol monooxygenase YgiN
MPATGGLQSNSIAVRLDKAEAHAPPFWDPGNCPAKGVMMTCIVILEVTAKKGTGLQLVETFRGILPDTRNKDGCQGVEVTTNLDNSDNLVLVERWATRKHYENYLAWRQQRGDLDKLAGALAGPPSIRYFDLTNA